MFNWQRFVEVNHYQSSARSLILFKTKTCLDFKFLSRPIPRLVLKLKFIWRQYQYLSWFGISVKTNTKTSLDIWNNSRPIPILRLLTLDLFETNTNTNTEKFNLIKMPWFQASQEPKIRHDAWPYYHPPINRYLWSQKISLTFWFFSSNILQ